MANKETVDSIRRKLIQTATLAGSGIALNQILPLSGSIAMVQNIASNLILKLYY